MIVAHRVEIKRLLQSTFPELERIGNLAPRVMQDFIPEFPSARLVKTAKELILRGKVRTLQHLQERHGELTKILTEYCKSSMLEDSEIMTSIDGVNRRTATTFLAEIGCIGSYASHKKLIALAGIDPTVYQSGKFEGKSRISKRGNQHLRRVIWLMTVCVIQHNNTFRTCLMKKIGARASRSRRQYLQRCINSYG